MDRFVGIDEAADALGVSITTLLRWESEGKLVAEHTPGGHRRYDLSKLRPEQYRAASVDAAIKLVEAHVTPTEAARQIGIGRSTIYREMRRLGVARPA